jgi:hypothetical protein
VGSDEGSEFRFDKESLYGSIEEKVNSKPDVFVHKNIIHSDEKENRVKSSSKLARNKIWKKNMVETKKNLDSDNDLR